MNILFINSLRKNRWGGGEKWMVEAAAGLSALGHHTIVGCLKNSFIEHKAVQKGVETIEFGIPSDISFLSIPKLKRILISKHIDVLVCCQNKDVKIGGRAARQAGIKAVFSRQGLQLFTKKRKYKYPFTRLIDGIITNTQSIKQIYESFGWFTKDFIHVIYNGMSMPKVDKTLNRQKIFGTTKDEKIILSAGRLSEQKGFSFLIDAAKMCIDKKLNYRFFIAGSGKLEAELKSRVKELNLGNYVHFIGFIEDLSAYYSTADVFVLPSLHEGMPNVVMESMAHGTVAIATRVNGAEELIEDRKNGFLIEPESAEQIAERLEIFFSDTVDRETMAKQARLHIEKNFTTEVMSRKLETLFLNQLNKTS
ncbi:glycosyltransferase family 4 protein [Saccharicrinis sp. FJH62]|uniref:glycosyltransferase family 4 protein n=1 Tax=Saccharicrinis sp. FJH62 TaxID=3344657 RepID=UPI0035D48757